jgi:hypothetical protein
MLIQVETAVLRYLDERGSCTIEELFRALSRFTLNQVFFAIDRLSRDGRVSLRHPARFAYLVSVTGSGTHNQTSRAVENASREGPSFADVIAAPGNAGGPR